MPEIDAWRRYVILAEILTFVCYCVSLTCLGDYFAVHTFSIPLTEVKRNYFKRKLLNIYKHYMKENTRKLNNLDMAFGIHHYLGICLEDYGLCLNVTESHPHKYKYFEQRCPSQWNRFSSSAAAAAGSPRKPRHKLGFVIIA